MSDNKNDRSRTWMTVLIIVCMLPVLAFPSMLMMTPPDSPARTLAWVYPFYVIASGICARICYPERQDISWILIVLMLMSHLAMWYLVLNPA